MEHLVSIPVTFVKTHVPLVLASIWMLGFVFAGWWRVKGWMAQAAYDAKLIYPGENDVISEMNRRMKAEAKTVVPKITILSALWPVMLTAKIVWFCARWAFAPVFMVLDKAQQDAIAKSGKKNYPKPAIGFQASRKRPITDPSDQVVVRDSSGRVVSSRPMDEVVEEVDVDENDEL